MTKMRTNYIQAMKLAVLLAVITFELERRWLQLTVVATCLGLFLEFELSEQEAVGTGCDPDRDRIRIGTALGSVDGSGHLPASGCGLVSTYRRYGSDN